MIRKEARTGLKEAAAKMARNQILAEDPHAEVQLIQQADGLWTVAAEWEDGEPAPPMQANALAAPGVPAPDPAPLPAVHAVHAVHAPVPLPEAAAALITVPLLQAAAPGGSADYFATVAPLLSDSATAYQVDRPLRIAHFLAQIAQESGFKIQAEEGFYSAPRMRKVFGCSGGSLNYDGASDDCRHGRSRDKLWSQADKYAGNARNLFSYVYAGRNGNGDEASQDGYRYRGRGLIQLTFKDNYRKFSGVHDKLYPADVRDFVASPDLVSTQLRYGVEVAFFFWDAHELNALADRDDAAGITEIVNGGLSSLGERKDRLARVKKALGI